MTTEYLVRHTDAVVFGDAGLSVRPVLAKGRASDCVNAALSIGSAEIIRKHGDFERVIDFETLLECARLEALATEYDTPVQDTDEIPDIR